jgi:molybdopterin synthase catalytic subunit
MAEREMRSIANEAGEMFGVTHLIVEHRLGTLGLGDISVAVVAAHAHRAPALDANRYVIEQLKRRVPIWKLEHYRDGTREWVGAGTGNREPGFEIPRAASDASPTQDSVSPRS